jgi:hypothetical protein
VILNEDRMSVNRGNKIYKESRIFRFARVAFLCVSLFAVAKAAPQEASSPSPVVMDPMLDSWVARKKAIGANRLEQADVAVRKILLERLNRGIANLPVYSATLVKESIEANVDNQAIAPKLLDQARDLAPDFYAPYFVEAGDVLAEGRVIEAIGIYLTGWTKKYSAFQTAFPAAFNIISVLMGAYYWLVVIFAGIMLARYSKLVAHDLRERVSGIDRRASLIMTAVLALFPAAFIPSLVLYSFILILILWIYTNFREKIIAAVLVAFLFLIPLPFKLVGNGLSAMSADGFRAVLNVREGVWGAADINALSEALGAGLSPQGRENVTISLAKALGYSGEFEKSIALLEGFHGSDDEVEAMVEVLKGNIYFRWEKYSEALKCYEKAAKLNPDSPIAHFNLASALSRPEVVAASADSLDRADKEMQKVKEKYSQILDTWTRYQELDPGRFAVDEPLPIKCLWNDMWTFGDFSGSRKEDIFRSFSGGIPLRVAPFVALTLLALMGALTIAERKIPHARACRMCGKAFCPKCQTETKDNTVCARCWSAFETRAGIDPRVREKVRSEVRSKMGRTMLIAEIISIPLPGSGHLLLGKTLRGAVFVLISLLLYFGVAYRNGVLRSEWFAPVYFSPIVLVALIVFCIVYVGLIVWTVSRQK